MRVRERDESTVTISLSGEVDSLNCDEVDATIHAALLLWPAVVVDLGAVTFCDSSGLSVFVRCERAAGEHGGRFALANARTPIRRIVKIAGLEHLLAA